MTNGDPKCKHGNLIKDGCDQCNADALLDNFMNTLNRGSEKEDDDPKKND